MKKIIGWVIFVFGTIGILWKVVVSFFDGVIGVKDILETIPWILPVVVGWMLADIRSYKTRNNNTFVAIVAILVLVGGILGYATSLENTQQQNLRTVAPVTVPQTQTVTQTSIASPEGSVLSSNCVIDSTGPAYQIDGYIYPRFVVTTKIMNVGEDGSFYVNAEVTEKELVTQGNTPQKIKVYLSKGEEKFFTFDFFMKNPNFHYRVWCSNY